MVSPPSRAARRQPRSRNPVMRARAPHAVRGWWRYSGLVWWQLAGNVVLAGYSWLAAARGTGPPGGFDVVIAVAFTALGLAQLGYGTVRAERARRFGCW